MRFPSPVVMIVARVRISSTFPSKPVTVIESPISKGSCSSNKMPARRFCRIFWEAKPIAEAKSHH
jgi:hypothetical protein